MFFFTSTNSEDYFIHCVCNRLSRLIALRASLPCVPGPGDGDVDTSVAILNEIGGPNNLSRLIGIMNDLLNQCCADFKVCCEFTGISKKINRLVMEYASSLNVSMMVSNDKQPVGDGNERIIQYCTYYPLDLDKLKRIRVSVCFTHRFDLSIFTFLRGGALKSFVIIMINKCN